MPLPLEKFKVCADHPNSTEPDRFQGLLGGRIVPLIQLQT